jgi:hypothetical protein
VRDTSRAASTHNAGVQRISVRITAGDQARWQSGTAPAARHKNDCLDDQPQMTTARFIQAVWLLLRSTATRHPTIVWFNDQHARTLGQRKRPQVNCICPSLLATHIWCMQKAFRALERRLRPRQGDRRRASICSTVGTVGRQAITGRIAAKPHASSIAHAHRSDIFDIDYSQWQTSHHGSRLSRTGHAKEVAHHARDGRCSARLDVRHNNEACC